MIKSLAKKIITNSDFLSSIRRKYNVICEEKKHKKRVEAYRATNNSSRIMELKNSMEGKRCFIIGNGPSLKFEDLDLLKNEYCFAANRIWLMYDKTSWRPACYMCQDWKMIRSEADRISSYSEMTLIGFDGMYEQGINISNSIGYLCDKRPYAKRTLPFPFSFACENSVIDGTIVTYSAIQIALYMGFKEIYLIGVDNNYQYTIDKNKKMTMHAEVKEAHFDPRYKELAIKESKNSVFGISDPEMSNGAY